MLSRPLHSRTHALLIFTVPRSPFGLLLPLLLPLETAIPALHHLHEPLPRSGCSFSLSATHYGTRRTPVRPPYSSRSTNTPLKWRPRKKSHRNTTRNGSPDKFTGQKTNPCFLSPLRFFLSSSTTAPPPQVSD